MNNARLERLQDDAYEDKKNSKSRLQTLREFIEACEYFASKLDKCDSVWPQNEVRMLHNDEDPYDDLIVLVDDARVHAESEMYSLMDEGYDEEY